MSKFFDFDEQLRIGRKGERLLLLKWPDPVCKHEVLTGPDFVDSKGRVIELKTDTYDMDRTHNFFFERFSNVETQSPGGIWQAALKGSTCFVYLFINNKRWFIFEDLPALCAKVEQLIIDKNLVMHKVQNRNWVTGGYKIPRAAVRDLYREEVL